MERSNNSGKKHTMPSFVRIAVGGRQQRRNSQSEGTPIDDVAAVFRKLKIISGYT